MRWIVRGDIDGFFGLALDNLVQLLLIDTLCRVVLGFPTDLVYGRVLPGAAISILVGNIAYAIQARKLAERTGRRDVCALPYGINTVSLFAHVFLIMLPAKPWRRRAGRGRSGAASRGRRGAGDAVSGIIRWPARSSPSAFARRRRVAALLSTLAGSRWDSFPWILFRTFAHPVVGLTTLAIVMSPTSGRSGSRDISPGGIVAVFLGTVRSWATGTRPRRRASGASGPALSRSVFGDLAAAIGGGHLVPYLSVITP